MVNTRIRMVKYKIRGIYGYKYKSVFDNVYKLNKMIAIIIYFYSTILKYLPYNLDASLSLSPNVIIKDTHF